MAPAQWQAPPNPYGYMMDTPGIVQPAYGYGPQPYAQLNYAGFWIRVVAYVIDSIIVSIIGGVLGFVLGLIAGLVNPNAVADSQTNSVAVANYVVGFLLSFAYYAGLWTLNGATFGQRICGLRVVDDYTFQPIGPVKATIRYFAMWLSFALCFLGVLWVAFDSHKQGLHDKLAGTLVVRG